MIRRPPRSTRVRSSAASDVYKRQARGERIQRTSMAHLSSGATPHLTYYIKTRTPCGLVHQHHCGWTAPDRRHSLAPTSSSSALRRDSRSISAEKPAAATCPPPPYR